MTEKFRFIETNRFILRNLEMEDLPSFLTYRSDERVAMYQPWDVFDEEAAIEYIEEYKNSQPGIPGQWFQLGIEQKMNSRFLGDCALKQRADQPKIGEVGINVASRFQGKGYAKEALSGLIDYAFNELGLHKIIGITDVDNIASQKMLEGLGFRKEAHFRQQYWFKGRWGDEFYYGLLKSEWKKAAAPSK